jgi:hypothetical protein
MLRAWRLVCMRLRVLLHWRRTALRMCGAAAACRRVGPAAGGHQHCADRHSAVDHPWPALSLRCFRVGASLPVRKDERDCERKT